MSKVIIHIGTHKTGTTAIQNFLRNNEQNLKALNVVYVETENNSIVQALNNKQEQDKKNFSQWIQRSIDKNSNTTYIFSWEGFSGDNNLGYPDTQYFAKLLGETFNEYNTSIVGYFRRQDDFMESLYTQAIHEGSSIDFDSFVHNLQKQNDLFQWDKFFKEFRSIFLKEKIIAKIYEKEQFKNGNILEDFCEILEISYQDLDELPKDLKYNIGYSRQALEFAKKCNTFLQQDEKDVLRKLLQSSNSKELFEKYHFFTNKQRFEFLEFYKESNEKFAQTYCNGKTFKTINMTNEEDSNQYEITLDDSIEVFSKIIVTMFNQQELITDEVLRLNRNEKMFANSINHLQKQNEDIISVLNQLANS